MFAFVNIFDSPEPYLLHLFSVEHGENGQVLKVISTLWWSMNMEQGAGKVLAGQPL